MSKLTQVLIFGAGVALVAAPAMAANVIDTAGMTAITTSYGDMKDTVAALISGGWAFTLAVTALLAAPKVVKKIISNAVS